ncbi:MAG: S8 family serine peptidase, partial [Chloroflexota bacterium]
MKVTRRPVVLILGVVLLLTLPTAALGFPTPAVPGAAPADFTIHLRSRQFVPAPGLEAALEHHLATATGARLHAIAQLYGPLTLQERGDLAAQGVRLLRYIPQQGWLASIPNDVTVLRGLLGQRVRWFGQLQANDRLSPDVRQGQFGPWAVHPDGTVELVVTFFDDVDPAAARVALEPWGSAVPDSYPGGVKFVTRVARAQIPGLAQEDGVQWIAQVPPPKQTLNDGVRAVAGVETYHGDGFTGSGVVAAMWDAGYVGAHPDFGARVSQGDSTGAVHNHATHVAGTMAGAGAVNPAYEGMAPASNVVSYFWDNHLDDYPNAVNVRGARLSQNSWGYYSTNPSFCYRGAYIWDAPELDQIVRGYTGIEPLAEGIPVMFAAGNDQKKTDSCLNGSGYDTVTPPATAKNVISVGAINTNDSSMTSFSSWGPTND